MIRLAFSMFKELIFGLSKMSEKQHTLSENIYCAVPQNVQKEDSSW